MSPEPSPVPFGECTEWRKGNRREPAPFRKATLQNNSKAVVDVVGFDTRYGEGCGVVFTTTCMVQLIEPGLGMPLRFF